MTEQWIEMLDHRPGAYVSNMGRIRKVGGIVYNGSLKTDSHTNYRQYNPWLVHRLVLYYFVRPPHEREQCDHIDHDGENNNVLNLRWLSASDNCLNRRMKITDGKVYIINRKSRYVARNPYKNKVYSKSYQTLEEAQEHLLLFKELAEMNMIVW